jgi:TonB family protein
MANGITKTIDGLGSALLASFVIALLPHSARALRPTVIASTRGLYVQESGVGAPLGKLYVSPTVMGGHCVTMVSPSFPQTAGEVPKASTVLVRVVIWKSGNVTPMRVVSGDPALETEAMSVVRLWRYKPFVRDDEPLDVTTDVRVDFEPGHPGGIVTHPSH